MFWFSLYLAPVLWGLFAFISVLKFSLGWLLVTIVAITMSMANVIGYTKCEKVCDAYDKAFILIGTSMFTKMGIIKDAKAKVTSYLAGQGVVQGFVGNMISNRLGNLFGGGSNQTPAR